MNFANSQLSCRFAAVSVAVLSLFFLSSQGRAVDWFDDFSDGSADSPPVQWSASPVFPGSYDASSGDYILTPTDDPNQPTGPDDENLLATVNDVTFTDISVRTRAVVGFSDTPDPDRNADFSGSGLVGGPDFVRWQQSTGGTGTQQQGDANFDTFVDDLDLDIWGEQYGQPPNLRGGNVGVVARFNPTTGNGYVLVIDDGNQWNLLASEQFGTFLAPINDLDGENEVPVDPDTGQRINAESDIMIQLDVTGQGQNNLLEVWFWRPGEPMPTEPFFSRVDDFSTVTIDSGAAGLIYNEDTANSPGIYRFAQASDTHLGPGVAPVATGVPEPTSGLLGVALAGMLWQRRSTRRGERR